MFTFSWSDAPLGRLPAGDMPAMILDAAAEDAESPADDVDVTELLLDGGTTGGTAGRGT